MAEESYTFSDADFGEDEEKLKEVWTIFGEKGMGKTTFALGMTGSKTVVNYDKKTRRAIERMFADPGLVNVFDGVKFYRGANEHQMTEAGCRSVAYIVQLLNKAPPLDWVVHDGLDTLIEIAEMKMRHDSNLTPFSGVDMSLWKHRKAILREIHALSMMRANKGVVYVTNAEETELVESGRLIRKGKVPRWVDIIMRETDNVVRTEMRTGKDGSTHFVAVFTTVKVGPWQNGQELDVTNMTLAEATAAGNKSMAALEKLFDKT